MSTLRTPQHSQTETAPPNGYTQNPSNVAKRRRHHQTATLRARQHSQTRVASPDGYAYGISAQPNGESIAKRLRSEPVNAAKRRRHRQTTTLRPIQSSPPPLFPSSPSLFPALGVAKRRRHHQTATLRGQEVMSSHSCPVPNCLIRSTTPVIPAICNPTPITREIPPATRQSALCNPLRYADEWYETAHNTRGSIERRNENVRTYQWH